ncbi:hypothetical protein LCGC14_2335360 [marine sediment metagenome]|uniref:Uncharacterized protein n=1 Tax=marine sediment metagenome TaxID=412755 RepID=A0A0F9F8M9_9ZZZZ
MPIDDREFGEFVGSTNKSLQNIETSLQRGNEKFDQFDKRLRAVETHNPNGWRGAIRPGAIGVGGAGALHFAWEIFRAMVPGG